MLGADKVDVFLYEADDRSLVALGVSDTPIGGEHELGLDRLPLAGGGQTTSSSTRRVTPRCSGGCRTSGELRAISEELGVQSSMVAPLVVNGQRRGVLLASSVQPDRFTAQDLRFLEAVSDWIALVTHRTELVERLAARAAGRLPPRGGRGHQSADHPAAGSCVADRSRAEQ